MYSSAQPDFRFKRLTVEGVILLSLLPRSLSDYVKGKEQWDYETRKKPRPSPLPFHLATRSHRVFWAHVRLPRTKNFQKNFPQETHRNTHD